MRKSPGLNSIVAIVMMLGAGCNEAFEPFRGEENSVVVYSVLNNKEVTQFARVFITYVPPEFNTSLQDSDTPVKNAQVSLLSGSNSFSFRDTLVTAWADNHGDSTVYAYTISPFVPQRGNRYTLTVSSEYGLLTSQVTMPGVGSLAAINVAMLVGPFVFPREQDIELDVVLAQEAAAYTVHFYLEYEITIPGGWLPQRIEIPLIIEEGGSLDSLRATYPSILKRPNISSIVFRFPLRSYQDILSLLRARYTGGTMRAITVTFKLIQYEEQLYRYSTLSAGFQDPFSVRSDQPEYTNIQGGVGLFGAFSQDSVYYAVPPTLGL